MTSTQADLNIPHSTLSLKAAMRTHLSQCIHMQGISSIDKIDKHDVA